MAGNAWFLRLQSALVAAVVLILAAGCGSPEPDSGATAGTDRTVYDAAAQGRMTYATYCQGCHGPEGHADGPVAPLLNVKLSDLGQITAKYGQFPDELIRATVDGRAEVEGHGTREMPVWGNIWNDPADPVAEERVRQQIEEIVAFIASIQQPAEPVSEPG